ncbi:hypothetical protein [Streptomyces sp. NPDC126514]|uniref:hypothetical protein n=1 Tax=Streptomyces sp. NPDC126514 TaxID=3155210 RepID=UPI00331F7AC1
MAHGLAGRGGSSVPAGRLGSTSGVARALVEQGGAGEPRVLLQRGDVIGLAALPAVLSPMSLMVRFRMSEHLRQVGLAAAMDNTDAKGIAMIQLIASGAPMAEDLAEGRLRYRMAR